MALPLLSELCKSRKLTSQLHGGFVFFFFLDELVFILQINQDRQSLLGCWLTWMEGSQRLQGALALLNNGKRGPDNLGVPNYFCVSPYRHVPSTQEGPGTWLMQGENVHLYGFGFLFASLYPEASFPNRAQFLLIVPQLKPWYLCQTLMPRWCGLYLRCVCVFLETAFKNKCLILLERWGAGCAGDGGSFLSGQFKSNSVTHAGYASMSLIYIDN